MKLSTIITGAVVAILLMWGVGSYNSMVGLQNRVEQSYAQVQNVLQRQADLLPNLAETVKGYAGHESETFKAVSDARSQMTAVAKMNPADLKSDPALQRQLVEAQAAMGSAMLKVAATREAYPNLKADAMFIKLMAELAGSQNRITVERQRNQAEVTNYNTSIQQFPRVIFAGIFGYKPYPFFKANDSAQSVPQINFSK